jgi:hypothetical protein
MGEFEPKDQKDTAEGTDKFLRGKRFLKIDMVHRHLSVLENFRTSEDLCHVHLSAVGYLGRDLGPDGMRMILGEIARMWVESDIDKVCPNTAVMTSEFIRGMIETIKRIESK